MKDKRLEILNVLKHNMVDGYELVDIDFIDEFEIGLMELFEQIDDIYTASGGLNDGKGFVFGKDTNGGIVVLDIWKRGLDRVNSNFVVMGTSGVGKSTATKHLILNEYMRGTKIICIDPEREYKTLCKNLGGDWINIVIICTSVNYIWDNCKKQVIRY